MNSVEKTNMSFTERLTGLLTSPDRTMENIAKDPHFEEAALIVAVYAILAAISAYLTTTHLTYVYTDPNVPDLRTFTIVMAIVMGLIMPFVIWLIISVLLYLFAMVFGGEGKFVNVFAAIDNTYLVKIFAAVVALLLLSQAPHVTVEISTSNPLGSLSGMSDYTKSTVVMLSNLVIMLGVLWSSFIGIFGIKHTEKISLTNAAIVVGVPLAIYIIYMLATLLIS